jgi:hypothetical protein
MFYLTWSRLVVQRLYNLHPASQTPRRRRILEFRPNRLSFPSPFTGRLHFRLRGLTDITLKAYCLRCSPAACCVHLVSTVIVEDRRFHCGPVAPSHMVRGGPSRGPAGLAGLSGRSSLTDPPWPGPAILPGPSNDWAEPAAFGCGPQPWSPSACALAQTYPESGVSSSYERVQTSSERLQATESSRPLAVRGRFQRTSPFACRCGPAAAGPHLLVPAPVRVRHVGRQSRVSTPNGHQYPTTRCQYLERANG